MSTTLSGQDILDRVRIRLGTLTNAFSTDDLLSFAEEGMQEVWGVLKSFDQEYFGTSSQDNDSTQDSYFADLSTTAREYNLPPNCREIRSIECLTSGCESTRFEQRIWDDQEFQAIRRANTNHTGSNASNAYRPYLYSVFGTQLVLAEFPQQALNVRIWYIKALNLLTVDTVISDILYPFVAKIVDFAVQKAAASARDVQITTEWLEQWKAAVVFLGESSGPRASTNPVFITDCSDY